MSERLVIDLDDTLVFSSDYGVRFEIRPGAEDLLSELAHQKHDLILWTGSPQNWQRRAFKDVPLLERYFCEIYTASNRPAISDRMMNLAFPPDGLVSAKAFSSLGHALSYIDGRGKDPQEVGSRILIDDDPWIRSWEEALGFKWINAGIVDSDPTPTFWVERVLNDLNQALRTPVA